MACEDCPVKAALIPALEALDYFLYGGKAEFADVNRFTGESGGGPLTSQQINELGAPIHEALVRLRGE